MNPKQDVTNAQTFLNEAQDVVVLLGENISHDAVAAGLSFYLSLIAAGKRATIATPEKITVELSDLIGIDKITSVLGNKNFVISLNYGEESIEKVSYHVDQGKFNLVIEPRENAPQISRDNVSYSYSGFTADLILAIGVQSIEQLGDFYTNNKAIFADKPLVVIDNKLTNRRFGKANIIRNTASLSELAAQVLKELQMTINADVATNLYSGIMQATDNFSKPQVNADTFETIAALLRNGARKSWGKRQEKKLPGVSALYKKPTNQPIQEERPKVETQARGVEGKEGTPPDWLKPKVYRGATNS